MATVASASRSAASCVANQVLGGASGSSPALRNRSLLMNSTGVDSAIGNAKDQRDYFNRCLANGGKIDDDTSTKVK